MTKTLDLRGIVPPVATPYKADDTVDTAALRRLVRHLIDGGVQGPVGIGQMHARKADQIGAAGDQDRIHLIRVADVAHGHCGNAGLIADAVAERGLEHAAIERLFGRVRLA